MRTTFNGRPVEITESSVGRHFDEACIEAANYTDGAMEDLDDNELDELTTQEESALIQDAMEFAADYGKDYDYD